MERTRQDGEKLAIWHVYPWRIWCSGPLKIVLPCWELPYIPVRQGHGLGASLSVCHSHTHYLRHISSASITFKVMQKEKNILQKLLKQMKYS